MTILKYAGPSWDLFPYSCTHRGIRLQDLHPWLLACLNGPVDLRTGKFGHGRPQDMITVAGPAEWKGMNEPGDELQLGSGE
jgi:hypothetical protein